MLKKTTQLTLNLLRYDENKNVRTSFAPHSHLLQDSELVVKNKTIGYMSLNDLIANGKWKKATTSLPYSIENFLDTLMIIGIRVMIL